LTIFPLVAASLGNVPGSMDAKVWHFIAYAAETGGSMLIIGFAAGVVAMGMEKISFFWYFEKDIIIGSCWLFRRNRNFFIIVVT
jgi:hypothetical protein